MIEFYIIIVAIALSSWAVSNTLKNKFKKYSKVHLRNGMSGAEIAEKMLADHGIYVKHLGIGWNEWRYHWETWNHHHEWELTDVMNYVVSGPDPGELEGVTKKEVCPIEGGLGC